MDAEMLLLAMLEVCASTGDPAQREAAMEAIREANEEEKDVSGS